jgi:hypothetical protein
MNYKNNGRFFNKVFQAGSQNGQALILVMAIVLIASVVVFLVFNSGRAVNEKINLVNAADAAAYSGAQIAARQLNFMAYTNRAMIANELALGHILSFQMEFDVTTQSLSAVADFLDALLGWIPIIGPFINQLFQIFVVDGLQAVSDIHSYFVGGYASLIDANNAFYSTMQYEAYKDLAYPVNGVTLVESAMQRVVNEYRLRPDALIRINDQDTIDTFVGSDDPKVAGAAGAAENMNAAFCQMVLFAAPGNDDLGEVQDNNDVAGFCNQLGDSGDEGGQLGSPSNPTRDDGAMVSLLRSMVSEFGNAEWIRDRDSYYRVLGFNFTRRGSTTVDIDSLTGQLNWRAASDTLRIGDPIFNIAIDTFGANGDITGLSQQLQDEIASEKDKVVGLLASTGLCERDAEQEPGNSEPSCEDALGGTYGGIKRYTYLNPVQSTPVITAFLSQTSCGDTVGVDDQGNRLEEWRDGARFLDERRPFCNGAEHNTVYAVAQAQVLFERPSCDDPGCTFGFRPLRDDSNRVIMEQPNLFNPFWQARLVP